MNDECVFSVKNISNDIIVNGFGIKETILKVLKKHKEEQKLDDCGIEELAEEIKDAFAEKMNLKQG